MATLTNDAVLAVAELLGVQTLPTVLAVGPRQDSRAAFTAARAAALRELRDTGLVDSYDDIDLDIGAALMILARPERQLAARVCTESGVRRVCVARRGVEHAVAVRSGDDIEVCTLWADEDGASLARPILDVLGPAEPADITGFGCPTDELSRRLDDVARPSEFAEALHGVAVDERAAIEFGMALSCCRARTEIVAYAHDEGCITRSSGAVAVYDTERGRIVASPGLAADLRLWSTFTPGSAHRVAQAVTALIATLPGGRWLP
ncbi:ESX secretion-associated protein EspG [Nocardia vermiculata]|uniref:ESX secretion-associated protein EspG n=1 Tax=Nocardia vermiculata TaxID=257274 RepID=A0A846XTI6_9NOCA|nr:ESX secretion-associated protein EspG [Nocardia vermiculata]NKY50396.1 ESX secretion-associated protein EspG [Nocardia vermiculata]